MKILFVSGHIYPAEKKQGCGKVPTDIPSGSAEHQFDLLAKGLANSGHQVLYFVKRTPESEGLHGIQFVDELTDDVDLVHVRACRHDDIIEYYQNRNIPVLATSHDFRPGVKPTCKWMYVSQTLAELYHEKQYIWNGLDPEDYSFTSTKQNYFLFIADLVRYEKKGLDIFLNLGKAKGLKMIVAGTSTRKEDIDQVQALCDRFDASYVGDVRGEQKAQLIAGARALVSPSRLQEAFGITLVEALFSGTPVICSNSGAYGEIISPDVGFVCNNDEEYDHAIDNIHKIDPETCRAYAIRNFHYQDTLARYTLVYQEMCASQAEYIGN